MQPLKGNVGRLKLSVQRRVLGICPSSFYLCANTQRMKEYILMPRFLVLAVFLLLHPVLLAQGVDIRGVVADSANGEKLPFANVVITGINKGASTNIQGFYLIANLSPGRYEMTASSIGYERQTKFVNVRVGQPVDVNFRLAPKPVEFSEVLVTDQVKRLLIVDLA